MVTNEHYRWDFIGLSTDTKPTPATSEKVVDGSTFYCSDTSKLYVYCRDKWYERKSLGGGGTSYTAGNGIDITDDAISVDTDVIQEKLTAGDNITIENGTISAAGSSVNVVQTTGTSTTDVMSQDATTKMITISPNQTSVNVLSDNSYGLYSISIGNNAYAYQNSAIAIGGGSSTTTAAYTTGAGCIAIGSHSSADGTDAIAIGYEARAKKETTSLGHEAGKGGGTAAQENVYLGHQAGSVTHTNKNSVALGHYAQITRDGEVSVGASAGTSGYAGTSYRVIGNVHDGQEAHDAVTVSQVNSVIDSINTTLSINIPHIGATS